MKSHRTDAELIEALKLIEKHGGVVSTAAHASGRNRSQLQLLKQEALARGFTAQSVLRDPLAKAQMELADAKRRIKELEHEEETAAAIREQIWKLESHDPNPPSWKPAFGTHGFRGMPMLFASDWHYGETVRPQEIGGLNEFNADIAAARIKRMTNTAIDLAFNHMGRANTKYPGIFLMYGGDMMSGSIHEEITITNDRTPIQCVNDLTDLMGAQVETLATKFGKIWVPCVTGNHGRNTKRMYTKGRVFHSYEWNVYCNLARSFKKNKNVHFNIPEETDCRFNVYGHRYLLSHGDMLGVKGGDGIIGALGPIRRGEIKIRNAESQIDRDFDTLVLGHWHQYIPLPGLIVNNSLKGYDEFARSILRAPFSRPSQSMWFTHPDHGVTAHWQIYLEGHQKVAKPTVEWFK